MSADHEREIRALDGGIDPSTMTATQPDGPEGSDKQIGDIYERIAAANDLLSKGVHPSYSCHADIVRDALTLMRLYDATRAERAGATAPEGVTADDLTWLRDAEAFQRRQVTSFERSDTHYALMCREDADRYARILAALATIATRTRERDEARTALTAIAGATNCVDTEPDEIAKHVVGFAGAFGLLREDCDTLTRERARESVACRSCKVGPLLGDEKRAGVCDECGAYQAVHGALPDDAWVRARFLRAHGFPAIALTDAMVERAARALYDEECDESVRIHYRTLARRALAAALAPESPRA
jgi:hypothetical protein